MTIDSFEIPRSRDDHPPLPMSLVNMYMYICLYVWVCLSLCLYVSVCLCVCLWVVGWYGSLALCFCGWVLIRGLTDGACKSINYSNILLLLYCSITHDILTTITKTDTKSTIYCFSILLLYGFTFHRFAFRETMILEEGFIQIFMINSRLFIWNTMRLKKWNMKTWIHIYETVDIVLRFM